MFTNRSMLMKLALAFAVMLIAAACGDTVAVHEEGHDEGDWDFTTTTVEEAAHTADEDHAEDETHAEDEDHAEDETPEAADADRVIQVSMSEFAFDPAIEVTAGETITFMVINAGVVEHEFRLSNAHRIEEHIAAGHEDHDEGGDMDDDMDEGGSHEENADIMIMVAAGETGEVTVTFPTDTTLYTQVACLIPGHYEAGMHAELSYDA
jgi:uncharacterized cupredoxin-like copper-binding protein